jgi:membrane dipeptidase
MQEPAITHANMRPLIDAHLDLAWSAMYFNRDLLASIADVRAAERGMNDHPSRGRNIVTFPELRRANVLICLATLLARSGPEQPPGVRTHTQRVNLDYATQAIAYGHAQGQFAYYQLLASKGVLRFITTRQELADHFPAWRQAPDQTPLGIILAMEGADPIVHPSQVQAWWERGLRVVGPVHYRQSHYAFGTGANGPLSAAGVELLKEFMRIGMILDVTHLSDRSFFHALDIYQGPMLASHHNCRALVPGDRQLSDEQIHRLIEREAVIGTAFDAWMLYPGWKQGISSPQVVSIAAAADHLDHICQLAGNARYCAIGTDLDGGFGAEQAPGDVDTITDIHKLETILDRRGYPAEDIDAIFFGNWMRLFGNALPE